MSKAASEQHDRLAGLAAMTDEPDLSDIPMSPPGTWSHAEHGRFHRPDNGPDNGAVTVRIDADILDWFRHHAEAGRSFQAAINAALRRHIETEGKQAG